MEKMKVKKLLNELDGFVADVNVVEIASHIDEEKLWNWCGAWREAIRSVLKELESEVLDERD